MAACSQPQPQPAQSKQQQTSDDVKAKAAGIPNPHVDPQAAHDGPIILTDGSVKLDLTPTLHRDLRMGDGSKFVASKFRGFITHTHASTLKSKEGVCTNDVEKTEFPQHAVEILNMKDRQKDHLTKIPIADCDTVSVFLERWNKPLDKWAFSIPGKGPMEVRFNMQYVDTAAAFVHSEGKDKGLAGQQAWSITLHNVPLVPDSGSLSVFHTDPGEYRLRQVTITGSKNQTFELSNGCSAIRILTGSAASDDPHPLPKLACH